MLQTLTDDGNKSKSAIKEKFTRFFDLFDETTERHQLARVLHDDDGARMQVSEEAVKLVVPSLQKFIQKNLGKEFSKSEYSVDRVHRCRLTRPVPRPKKV